MSIIGKVKKLVGAEEGAEEQKPKKSAKTKAVAATKEPKAPKAKKAAAPKAEPADVHEHDHSHEGHDHDHAEHAHVGARPVAVAGAVGVGATKYIVRPLVSEKGTRTAEHNTHMFVVLPTASKPAIREAIEKMYGVKVISVRTSRYDGKKVRSGRTKGQRSNFKKAFVTIEKGQTISLFKGV